MTTINIWKTHKTVEKNTNRNNIHYGVQGYFAVFVLVILTKKQPKIAYRTKVEFHSLHLNLKHNDFALAYQKSNPQPTQN